MKPPFALFYRLLLLLLTSILLAGCAGSGGGLGSISKTNQLSPGMKPAQVRSILGDPSQTQFISNKWLWKYSLHEPWKGFIPYYLVFSRDSQVLEQWFADEADYAPTATLASSNSAHSKVRSARAYRVDSRNDSF
jgi:outer membrane protein assembly factor BamE (lipoprotein component of BamABCDE complex)